MFVGNNPCKERNGDCEDLCLAASGNMRVCACRDGKALSADNKTCIGWHFAFIQFIG